MRFPNDLISRRSAGHSEREAPVTFFYGQEQKKEGYNFPLELTGNPEPKKSIHY
jgi:hypothetical protein